MINGSWGRGSVCLNGGVISVVFVWFDGSVRLNAHLLPKDVDPTMPYNDCCAENCLFFTHSGRVLTIQYIFWEYGASCIFLHHCIYLF